MFKSYLAKPGYRSKDKNGAPLKSMSDVVKDREESKVDPGDESKENSDGESKENSDGESKEEGEESKEGEQSKEDELPELWSGMLDEDEEIPEDMLDGVTPGDLLKAGDLLKDTGCGDEDFEKIFGGSLDDEKDGDSLNEDSSDEEED
tara:strand:+ start:2714 stop:3157 length:444 start_codon:yes stop_codon:yes gene_type:complete